MPCYLLSIETQDKMYCGKCNSFHFSPFNFPTIVYNHSRYFLFNCKNGFTLPKSNAEMVPKIPSCHYMLLI